MRMYEKRLPISGYVYFILFHSHSADCTIVRGEKPIFGVRLLIYLHMRRIANDIFWPRSQQPATNNVSRAASLWYLADARLSVSVQIKMNHDDHTESGTCRYTSSEIIHTCFIRPTHEHWIQNHCTSEQQKLNSI